MTESALRLLARDCHALADRLSHRDRWTRAHHDAILTLLHRCEHAFITQLVDAVVAAPKPREATTRSGHERTVRIRWGLPHS
jgi:hypothetical protein